jgi:secreted trypsin-like serine protease
VLVLKDQIRFGTYIQPACLPEPTTNVFNINGTVVGYGLSENTDTHENIPKFVEIPSLDHLGCLWNSQVFRDYGSNRSFCAGEEGKRPCKGDSGSGFYVQNGDSSFTVSGIVSSGSFYCNASQYAIFTSVPMFVEWIRQDMEKDGGDEEQGVGVNLDCKFDKYFV